MTTKKNEYKTEVDSLRLSDQFKENLKAKMLEEYEKGAEGEPEITVSGPGIFSKKYARYAAIAAAFVIVASTVSVLGVKGIRAKKYRRRCKRVRESGGGRGCAAAAG